MKYTIKYTSEDTHHLINLRAKMIEAVNSTTKGKITQRTLATNSRFVNHVLYGAKY